MMMIDVKDKISKWRGEDFDDDDDYNGDEFKMLLSKIMMMTMMMIMNVIMIRLGNHLRTYKYVFCNNGRGGRGSRATDDCG